jgi:hypothetical protein
VEQIVTYHVQFWDPGAFAHGKRATMLLCAPWHSLRQGGVGEAGEVTCAGSGCWECGLCPHSFVRMVDGWLLDPLS